MAYTTICTFKVVSQWRTGRGERSRCPGTHFLYSSSVVNNTNGIWHCEMRVRNPPPGLASGSANSGLSFARARSSLYSSAVSTLPTRFLVGSLWN